MSGLCETSEEDICDSTFQLVQFNISFRSGLCETSEEDICDSTFQLVQFNISIYVCMCLYVYVCEGMPELV